MKQEGRIVEDITAPDFKDRSHQDQNRILNDFAQHFGWHPSDYLEPRYGLVNKSNGHLIVEHGLEHAAVISFLSEPLPSCNLTCNEVNVLLKISYNNLIDLHLTIDRDYVSVYFNRQDSPLIKRERIEEQNFVFASVDQFQITAENIPRGNLPALDTVLIGTIDYWKRFLYSEIKCSHKNEAFSALFNAIIFVRAIEDHFCSTNGNPITSLLQRWRESTKKLQDVLLTCIRDYRAASKGASSLLTLDRLDPFNRIDRLTLENLIQDFYKVKKTPYEYNFALMSRHALSRIYEKYVALMSQEKKPKSAQQTLFPIDLPETDRNKVTGSIYTPQFIPRFFCRFIEAQLPPPKFQDLTVIDPTCGSGIFLRVFLEKKIEKTDLTTQDITNCFKRVSGLDLDENACQASRLSLSLLHLTKTNILPNFSALNIQNEEAINFYQSNENLHNSFGAVIGNPPFVRLELQPPPLQQRIKTLLSDIPGRRDLYLAILRIAMNMVRPGGFFAFVLPHSFLIGSAPQKLRQELRNLFWMRCVVDLSAIRVFEDFSAYIILIIAQKKLPGDKTAPSCRVVTCQDFISRALQDCLDNKTVNTPYYSVFDVDQDYFSAQPWVLVGREEVNLERKLKAMPKIGDFLITREGLITGDDDVFILSANDVPSEEKSLYAPFLPDRQIERYTIPRKTNKYVYYPYHDRKRISTDELKRFNKTWSYLTKNKSRLNESALGTWPYLVRGREQELLQPKIISPHLVLTPRFALDSTGRYAVSRAPFLIPREKDQDIEILKFFTAVLNSSVVHWYLGTHAYKFSHGYVKLDPLYIENIPVPDPAKVAPTLFREIVRLVDERIRNRNASIEAEIDAKVLTAYGMNADERKLLGVG